MYEPDTHIHFVGIGGVGMAGIAELLFGMGYSVSGSDLNKGQLALHLEKSGVTVFRGHSRGNLPENTAVVVYSSAIPKDNPEIETARERGIPVVKRAEMLAELMRSRYGIAVAGSHGKTTTTSITGHMLRSAGHDPSMAIGGRVLTSASGARLGGGRFFVAEADESDGSFSLLKPALAVVTNIDNEHLSHYGSFENLLESFEEFLQNLPFYGLAVVCAEDTHSYQIGKRVKDSGRRRVRFYGFDERADIRAKDCRTEGFVSKFRVEIDYDRFAVKSQDRRGVETIDIELPLSGHHQILNSLAAIAIGIEVGTPLADIAKGLASYPGVARRAEVLLETEELMVVDDYAHHPKEIAATVNAIKSGVAARIQNGGRLKVIFQPHRYSRTSELFEQFLDCFEGVDQLFISDIYAAGEKVIEGISSDKLASKIRGVSATYLPEIEKEISKIVADSNNGDVLLTMGAGSIGSIVREAISGAGLLQVKAA